VPLLYVILPAFVLYNMFTEQPAEALAGVGFIGLGAVLYFLLGLGRQPTGPILEPQGHGGPTEAGTEPRLGPDETRVREGGAVTK
jgi:hypothetical protein